MLRNRIAVAQDNGFNSRGYYSGDAQAQGTVWCQLLNPRRSQPLLQPQTKMRKAPPHIDQLVFKNLINHISLDKKDPHMR